MKVEKGKVTEVVLTDKQVSEGIKHLVRRYPNDTELGREVRKFINKLTCK